MATKLVSDLGGEDILAGQEVVLVVRDHPYTDGQQVELDIAREEIDRLEAVLVEIVHIVVKDGEVTKHLEMPRDVFDELFDGKAELVLKGAKPSTAPAASVSRTRMPKVDYRLPENAGIPHRGKVTAEEAEWVRTHLEQANKNRRAAGKPDIDPTNPADRDKYGF